MTTLVLRKLIRVAAFGVAFLAFGCRPSNIDLRERCIEAEKRGIDFLRASQQESGGFINYEWREMNPDNKRPVDTTFTVSQVLYALTFCSDNSTARQIREQATKYLVRQREEPGIWRY